MGSEGALPHAQGYQALTALLLEKERDEDNDSATTRVRFMKSLSTTEMS